MVRSFFTERATTSPGTPVQLPLSFHLEASRPEDYVAEPGLVEAVNAALLLGQPLLLTGEPGTGKTQLADALAFQLGYRLLRFEAKSNSQARDLFYNYDAVEHFGASRLAARSTSAPAPSSPARDALEFIQYAALGEAVLLANPRQSVEHLLPAGFEHPGHATPSVVLIDEVDKAPRDFPNDILVELERLTFRIPELRNARVQIEPAKPGMHPVRPVVVITSNSERDLPDAFLRRCVYYDIPFPDMQALRGILDRRLRSSREQGEPAEFLDEALAVFQRLRQLPGLRKRPATAELLAWLTALRRTFPHSENPLREANALESKLGVLIKSRADYRIGLEAIRRWSND